MKYGSSKISRFLLTMVLFLLSQHVLTGQDTLRISLEDFVKAGIKRSTRLSLERNNVELSKNRVDNVRSNKILPDFSVTTNHGVLPSPAGEVTDPAEDFEIDWSNLSVFTRVQFQLLQPITTWGAINKGIDAAKHLVKVEEAKVLKKERSEEQQLFELYQSRILTDHLKALVLDAEENLVEAKKRLDTMQEEGEDVAIRDIYQLKLFEQEFSIQKAELYEQLAYIEDMWALILREEYPNKVILPILTQMSSIEQPLYNLNDLLNHAQQYSAEALIARELIKAAELGVASKKASYIPMMYIGLGGEYVRTPIPVAQQPLIGDRNNFANLFYSFGFRFNLNLAKMKTDLTKSRIELNQARDARSAASQLKFFEVREAFKNFQIAKKTKDKNEKSLDLANEWLRQEQIDYDLEIGELNHLIDAVKATMQYKVAVARSIQSYNSALIELYIKTGYSVTSFKF